MLVCVGALGVGCAHHAWLAVDGRLPADAAARTNATRDAAILPPRRRGLAGVLRQRLSRRIAARQC